MLDDEAIYAVVAEEIRRSDVRPGLWTKALASTGYDEQKAKALYITLRVKSLKTELTEARRQAELQQRKEVQYQKEKKRLLHIEQLNSRAAKISPYAKMRKRIKIICFLVGFVLGAVSAYLYIASENPAEAGPAAAAALFIFGPAAGFLGVFLAEIIRQIMPSQRWLETEENRIDQEIEMLTTTRFERFIKGLAWLIAAAVIWYLLLK